MSCFCFFNATKQAFLQKFHQIPSQTPRVHDHKRVETVVAIAMTQMQVSKVKPVPTKQSLGGGLMASQEPLASIPNRRFGDMIGVNK